MADEWTAHNPAALVAYRAILPTLSMRRSRRLFLDAPSAHVTALAYLRQGLTTWARSELVHKSAYDTEVMERGSLLERLLPAGVVCREAFDDVLPAPLAVEEARVVAKAVKKRRQEFATARRCAREALAALGVPTQTIPSGPSREPCWPHGVVGSITHCAGYRAAVVARDSTVATIGVDAEPHERLPPGVLAGIALPDETEWVTRRAAIDGSVCWDRLLFCAKEAVYKAWFPLAGRWLGFEEAMISFDAASATFTARLRAPQPLVLRGTVVSEFSGRWLVDSGLLMTAIAWSPQNIRASGATWQ